MDTYAFVSYRIRLRNSVGNYLFEIDRYKPVFYLKGLFGDIDRGLHVFHLGGGGKLELP